MAKPGSRVVRAKRPEIGPSRRAEELAEVNEALENLRMVNRNLGRSLAAEQEVNKRLAADVCARDELVEARGDTISAYHNAGFWRRLAWAFGMAPTP